MVAAKQIVIEVYPMNPNGRTFHISTYISAETVQAGSWGSYRNNPFHIMSIGEGKPELTDDTKATLMRFYDIDGIDSVGLEAYKIQINRSPAYDWEELDGEITKAITITANWPDDDVEVHWLMAGKRYPNGVSNQARRAEAECQRRENEQYARIGL